MTDLIDTENKSKEFVNQAGNILSRNNKVFYYIIGLSEGKSMYKAIKVEYNAIGKYYIILDETEELIPIDLQYFIWAKK